MAFRLANQVEAFIHAIDEVHVGVARGTENHARTRGDAARGVSGRVLESAGPWRTSGDWWRDDGWSRDEWDVALTNGSLYLLSRDRRDGVWFLEGVYD